jgi:hypothetical protein
MGAGNTCGPKIPFFEDDIIRPPPENPFLKPPTTPHEFSFSFLALLFRSEMRPILSWVKILPPW